MSSSTPTPRPRGRPRKNSLSTPSHPRPHSTNAADNDFSDEAEAVEDDRMELVAGGNSTIKRRGRPASSALSSSAASSPNKRSKRAAAALASLSFHLGSDEEDSSSEQEDEPQRNRDEPKQEVKEKRGPGRPRLSAPASSIAARAREAASAFSGGLGPMSSVAAAAHSTQLNYFDQLAAPARKSNNTLKDVPKLSEEQRARIQTSLSVRHPLEKERLLLYHRGMMREWLLQLRAGFNLLAYGFGSKKQLLADFARHWLTDGPVVVFNGYYPGANVKNLLNTFTRELMQEPQQTFRDINAHVDFIRDWFRSDARVASGRRGRRGGAILENVSAGLPYDSSSDTEDRLEAAEQSHLPHVYLLIHNLDGASLRSHASQSVLSVLSSIPQVHLIASVDHILSGWMWDATLANLFNFVSHDCTTYAAYSAEFMFASVETQASAGTAGLVDSSQSGRAAGIVNVLSSLTPNHRKVLDVLAREQLTANNPNFAAGTTLLLRSALLESCEENMLVANANAFERLMHELRDHQLVEEKLVARMKVVCIPYSSAIIRRYILGETDEAVLAAAEEADAQANKIQHDTGIFAQAVAHTAARDGDEEEEIDDDEVDEAAAN